MRRGVLRRAILSLVVIATMPVTVVRAADIQPTVTLDPVAPAVYRGEPAAAFAVVSHGAPGALLFEWSSDGSTWVALPGPNASGDRWMTGLPTDASVPLGTRYIRASYPGSPGFLPAVSESQSQEVLIRTGAITYFDVGSPGISAPFGRILPTTAPIRLSAHATHLVRFDRKINGEWQDIGPQQGFTMEIPALGEGQHKFRARIDETPYNTGASQEFALSVARAATSIIWGLDRTVQANHALPAQVGVDGPNGGVLLDGPMTVTDLSTDTVIASGMVGLEFTIPPMPAGFRDFEVAFLGSPDYLPSSEVIRVTVTPDGADATGVTRNYSTFYPVKDGYRDSVTMSGNRLEAASVVIKIYSPGGSLVKAATLPRALGKYSYAWNGRTTSGALRAAGKYKIVQILTDAGGASTAFTSYVNLSHKKLVTKTGYVTKLGSAITAKGDPGSGSITISTSGGYARLTGKYPGGWVGVGYQFTLPSAAVYKSISFQVYSRGPESAGFPHIAVQNFNACPYTSSAAWSESCFDRAKPIGSTPIATTWFSTSANLTANRHGRTVRGLVSVPHSTQTIYKARIKVIYGVLQ